MFDNIIEVLLTLTIGLWIGIIISWLYGRMRIREQEKCIEKLHAKLDEKESTQVDLETLIQKNTDCIQKIIDEMTQHTNLISHLTSRVDQQYFTIDNLMREAEKKEEQIHHIITCAESSEARAKEMEILLTEAKKKASTKTQMQGMKDDLAIIKGIGPKTSTILKSAQITSFEKLASTSEKDIRAILETENSNILHLVDYKSWPEQARLAFVSDWEALTALQDSLS